MTVDDPTGIYESYFAVHLLYSVYLIPKSGTHLTCVAVVSHGIWESFECGPISATPRGTKGKRTKQ